MLTRRGLASVVFGVPVTYPPEPVRGTLVAGMLAPNDADYAWHQAFVAHATSRGMVAGFIKEYGVEGRLSVAPPA